MKTRLLSKSTLKASLKVFLAAVLASQSLIGCNQRGNPNDGLLLWVIAIYGLPRNPAPGPTPGPGPAPAPGPTTPPPYYGWYDYYGNACGSLGPGCNYYSGGYKIILTEDPYYSHSSTWDTYSQSWYSSYFGTRVVESPNGIVYDYYSGEALNSTGEVSDGKDIINSVAIANEKRVKAAGDYLSDKFSLSSEDGLRVASTLNDFVSLKNRSMKDLSDFSKRLYGININTLMSAVDAAKKGNHIPLEGAVEAAANHLNTTPEAMKELVQELHGHLLVEQGIEL